MSLQVRLCVQDMRERLTMTNTSLGSAVTSLQEIAASGRLRLKLTSPHHERGAGYAM